MPLCAKSSEHGGEQDIQSPDFIELTAEWKKQRINMRVAAAAKSLQSCLTPRPHRRKS